MRRTIVMAVAALLMVSSASCGIDTEPAHALLQRELAKCAAGPPDDEADCISWSLFAQRIAIERELPRVPDEPLRHRRICEDGRYRYADECPEVLHRMQRALKRAGVADQAKQPDHRGSPQEARDSGRRPTDARPAMP